MLTFRNVHNWMAGGYADTPMLRHFYPRMLRRDFAPAGYARQLAAIIASGSRRERLASLKAPTLVIHGQNDLRVPVNHGIELFHTLQRRGIPSKFVYYPDENHWILKPQNSLFWYSTVREWVEQYAPPGGR